MIEFWGGVVYFTSVCPKSKLQLMRLANIPCHLLYTTWPHNGVGEDNTRGVTLYKKYKEMFEPLVAQTSVQTQTLRQRSSGVANHERTVAALVTTACQLAPDNPDKSALKRKISDVLEARQEADKRTKQKSSETTEAETVTIWLHFWRDGSKKSEVLVWFHRVCILGFI